MGMLDRRTLKLTNEDKTSPHLAARRPASLRLKKLSVYVAGGRTGCLRT